MKSAQNQHFRSEFLAAGVFLVISSPCCTETGMGQEDLSLDPNPVQPNAGSRTFSAPSLQPACRFPRKEKLIPNPYLCPHFLPFSVWTPFSCSRPFCPRLKTAPPGPSLVPKVPTQPPLSVTSRMSPAVPARRLKQFGSA